MKDAWITEATRGAQTVETSIDGLTAGRTIVDETDRGHARRIVDIKIVEGPADMNEESHQ